MNSKTRRMVSAFVLFSFALIQFFPSVPVMAAETKPLAPSRMEPGQSISLEQAIAREAVRIPAPKPQLPLTLDKLYQPLSRAQDEKPARTLPVRSVILPVRAAPFSAVAYGDPLTGENIQVTVARNGNATVTWHRSENEDIVLNGKFDALANLIVLDHPTDRFDQVTLAFQRTQTGRTLQYRLTSFKAVFSGAETGSNTSNGMETHFSDLPHTEKYTFGANGLLQTKDTWIQPGTGSIHHQTSYQYVSIGPRVLVKSIVTITTETLNATTRSRSYKDFYDYDSTGRETTHLWSYSYFDENGVKKYAAGYERTYWNTDRQAVMFNYDLPRDVFTQIDQASDYGLVDAHATSRRVRSHRLPDGRYEYYVDCEKDGTGKFVPKMTLQMIQGGETAKTWIIAGKADLFTSETDDILLLPNQTVNGYSVNYGSTNNHYALIFDPSPLSGNVRVSVDYPAVKSVVLDNKTYGIAIDPQGVVTMTLVWPNFPNLWYVFQPNSIGIDHQGNIYSVEGSIKKFSVAGEFLFEINNYNFLGSTACLSCRPSHIAFDASDNFYVTDEVGIKKFSSAGQFLGEFQIPAGVFARPMQSHGIAVDPNGMVYVTDVNNLCVHQFDASGHYFGSMGQGILSSSKPRLGIVIDSKGFIYVADNNYSTVRKFDPNGTQILEWTWYDPTAYKVYGGIMMIDSQDRLYLGHRESGFLRKFDTDGNDVTPAWNDPNWFLATGVVSDGAVDAQGNIYLSIDRTVVKFDATGHFLQRYSSYTRDPSKGFFWPVGSTLGPDGTLYVRDENYSVFLFDEQGNHKTTWTLPHDLIPYPLADTSMAADARGHIFLAQGNLLVELDASGNVLNSLHVSELPGIETMAVDSQGFLWLQFYGKVVQWDPRTHSIVKSFDLNETVRAVKGYQVVLEGFSLDANGNIHLVDRNKGVFVFDPQGALLLDFPLEPHQVLPYGINYSQSLILSTTDAEGNIYVLFTEYGEIQKYDSRGNFITSFGEIGTQAGQMVRPNFIGVYSDGRVVVVEHGNNRLQIFSDMP